MLPKEDEEDDGDADVDDEGKQAGKMPSGKPLTKPYRPNIPPASQALNGALHPATTSINDETDFKRVQKKLKSLNNFNKKFIKI